MPKRRGDQTLPLVGLAACYEEINRSSVRCAAIGPRRILMRFEASRPA